MPKIPLLLILLMSMGFLQIKAQQPVTASEAESIRQRIQEHARKTATIESAFVQEKELSVLTEKIVSKGKFYFKKEKQLRWEYTTPYPYLIIISKDQMVVRDDSKENRINLQSNKVFREINNIILGAVQGTLLTDTKNFRSAITDGRTWYIVKLVPQSSKLAETLTEIILYFSKTDYSVERLMMRESSGDYTRIEFKERKYNQPIADEMFAIP